jgi:hypothetical protein
MAVLRIGGVLWACLWALAGWVQAESVTIAWNFDMTPPLAHTGFQVLRCAVEPGTGFCVPSTDLPGGTVSPATLAFTDTVEEGGFCWTVVALSPSGQSVPATTGPTEGSGTPYICKRVLAARPPPPTSLREVVQ